MNSNRRSFLGRLVAGGALVASAPLLMRQALAMGGQNATPGFRRVEGQVMLNDKPATLGTLVNFGDTVTTGKNSLAIFVVGRNAIFLRSESRLEISGENNMLQMLKLMSGKMLAVFEKGEKKIFVPTATMGIRGTGVYVEAEPTRAYLCTCYGKVDIQSTSQPEVRESVKTRHHETPRYIHAAGDKLITPAPMLNHTDDELFMLEALVGRTPAFYGPSYDKSSAY